MDEAAPDAGGQVVLTVATLWWDANPDSKSFSRIYDASWVEKLYRGFARNLTRPFRFVCYTERQRPAYPGIHYVVNLPEHPTYSDCIAPYEIDGPMILVGLDTVICGNIDHLADWCETADRIALPRDPYKPSRACNGVALIPPGWTRIASDPRAADDMTHVRQYPHHFIDDLWPAQVVSWKGHVEKHGCREARIIYFHGDRKPHQLGHEVIREHWV